MTKDFLLELAFENLSKYLGNDEWKESDEVILFSLANKEQLRQDEKYRETEECNYYGKRVCIFADQIKKNNYITLHKSMLTKIIEIMDNFQSEQEQKEEENE